jgi:uncharacterized protein YwqG
MRDMWMALVAAVGWRVVGGVIGGLIVVLSFGLTVFAIVVSQRRRKQMPEMSSYALRDFFHTRRSLFLYGAAALTELRKRGEDCSSGLFACVDTAIEGKRAERIVAWHLLRQFFGEKVEGIEYDSGRPSAEAVEALRALKGEYVLELKERLKRQASKMTVGGFRPSEDLFASWFGRVRVERADEAWPQFEGRPMAALCQMNIAELPYVPERLKGIALVTVFIDPEELPSDSSNGEGWELRAYASLDGLVEVATPSSGQVIKAFPVRWELIEEDYPCWEDLAFDVPRDVGDNYYDVFDNVHCSKVGGWPSLIQSEVSWGAKSRAMGHVEYMFQIDSEEKAQWTWGDTGTGYFGCGTRDGRPEWVMTWQCY